MWQQKLVVSLLVALFCMAHFAGAADPISCIVCDSSKEPNCITDLTKFTGTAGCAKSCYTKIDETGKVTRGCQADTDPECVAPNCQKCDAADCNKHNICKKCDSASDADCAQTDASKLGFNALCEAADTKCLSNVKADNQTERRCATKDDSCSSSSDTCQLCTGGNCNGGFFPAKRLQCLQCNPTTDGTKCSNVVANDIASKPCRLYEAADKCFTYGTDENSMTRGCVSDADTATNKCAKPETDALCLACATDNCNNQQYKRTQTLKCIKCTSTATDDSCQWGQTASSAVNCQNQIAYNAEEQCYTQTKDNVVYRGCYYDREQSLGECSAANACSGCSNGDGCNSKDSANFTCIRCRSDETPKCRNEATELTGSDCRKSVTQATSGCFYGKWNNVIIRGCLVDADDRMLSTCKDDKNNQCRTCPEKDCNTAKAGAASISAIASLLVGLLCVVWRLQ